jgi:hypothetical protein
VLPGLGFTKLTRLPSATHPNARATAQNADDKVTLIGAFCVVNVMACHETASHVVCLNTETKRAERRLRKRMRKQLILRILGSEINLRKMPFEGLELGRRSACVGTIVADIYHAIQLHLNP